MKFAPQFPSLKSIAGTIALFAAIIGGVEMSPSRNPRLGIALIIIAIVLFWLSRFLRPKTKSEIKTENYHIT